MLRSFVSRKRRIFAVIQARLAFRFFPNARDYQNHMRLHQTNDNAVILPQRPISAEPTLPMVKVPERTGEVKRIEPFYENAKSLKCPTCGKVRVYVIVGEGPR